MSSSPPRKRVKSDELNKSEKIEEKTVEGIELDDLPDEMLAEIFKYLDIFDRFHVGVNKRMKRIVDEIGTEKYDLEIKVEEGFKCSFVVTSSPFGMDHEGEFDLRMAERVLRPLRGHIAYLEVQPFDGMGTDLLWFLLWPLAESGVEMVYFRNVDDEVKWDMEFFLRMIIHFSKVEVGNYSTGLTPEQLLTLFEVTQELPEFRKLTLHLDEGMWMDTVEIFRERRKEGNYRVHLEFESYMLYAFELSFEQVVE